MKNGDQIKVFVQVGLMKKPRWLKGTLIASNRNLELQELKNLGFKARVKHEDEYLVEVCGNRLYLKPQDVREWRPLEFSPSPEFKCERMEQFTAAQWGDLKAKCRDSVAKFFPEVILTINEEEKTISAEDQYGPYLTVSPAVLERESICAFFEVPAWEIVLWQSIPATRWEPADVDEKNCGFSMTTIGAARLLVDNIWKLRTEDYWQGIQDAELGDAYEGEQW
jgi:hypothetical protein